MRTGIILACLSVPFAASASFELVLALDATTKSIHRFDGDTGAYLGAFGANKLVAPRNMVISQATGRAYVLDGNYIKKFNYNTGEYVGLFAAPVLVGADVKMGHANDGSLLIPNGGNLVRKVNDSGLVLQTLVASNSGFKYSAAAQLPSGIFVGIEGDATALGSKFMDYWYSNGSYNTGANMGLMTNTTNIAVGQWQENTTTGLVSSFATRNSSGFSVFGATTLGLIGSSEAGSSISAATGIRSVAAAHAGYWTCGLLSSDTTKGVIELQMGYGAGISGPIGTSVLKNPVALDVVLAPEPSSVLALAGGLALALRRRIKRVSR